MKKPLRKTKVCFKCLKRKPLRSFYEHPMMADGHLGKCKVCAKQDVSENRLKNIDTIRAYDRARSNLPHRKSLRAKNSKEMHKKDPRKNQAHKAVGRAVRVGELKREPCLICGVKKVEGHHEDYDKPLEVVWYCCVHHAARHKQMALLGLKP